MHLLNVRRMRKLIVLRLAVYWRVCVKFHVECSLHNDDEIHLSISLSVRGCGESSCDGDRHPDDDLAPVRRRHLALRRRRRVRCSERYERGGEGGGRGYGLGSNGNWIKLDFKGMNN